MRLLLFAHPPLPSSLPFTLTTTEFTSCHQEAPSGFHSVSSSRAARLGPWEYSQILGHFQDYVSVSVYVCVGGGGPHREGRPGDYPQTTVSSSLLGQMVLQMQTWVDTSRQYRGATPNSPDGNTSIVTSKRDASKDNSSCS